MVLALGIIIFIIGCCLSSYEDTSYNAQKKAEQRHKELMKVLSETKRINETPARRKQTRKRFAMDTKGNLLGEEITEEFVDD